MCIERTAINSLETSSIPPPSMGNSPNPQPCMALRYTKIRLRGM